MTIEEKSFTHYSEPIGESAKILNEIMECGHPRRYWYEPPPEPADRYHKDVYQLDPFCLVCHWEMDWDY